MRSSGIVIATCLAAWAALVLPASAIATYPGTNGSITFISEDNDIEGEVTTIEPDGSGREELSQNSFYDFAPRFSFDGRAIIFTRVGSADNPDLFLTSPLGGAESQLTATPSSESSPDLSPNGRKVTFAGDHYAASDQSQIYVMDSDGSDVRRLTSMPAWSPAFSSDGKSIVFVGEPDGENDSEIFRMRVNGRNVKRLTTNPVDDLNPEWSPDGLSVVFDTRRAGRDQEIASVSSNGGRTQILTHNVFEDSEPDFSPDGEQIVFQRKRHSRDREILTMTSHGGSLFNVTKDREDSYDPDWGSQ